MSYLYETYGPFKLSEDRVDHLGRPSSTFWEELEESHPRLSVAVGVYVIAVRTGKGEAMPWYVGMTAKGFEGRMYQHRPTFLKVKNASGGRGTQELYFLALKKKKQLGYVAAGKSCKLVNDFLETKLIDTCLKRNPALINGNKIKKFRETSVPGYMNDKGKRHPSAANFNALITGNKPAG